MIVVDLQQVMISNFMAQIGNHTNIAIDEELLRYMVLNSLRSYNSKFRREYGEMIIACDDRGSWRRQIFPYYKASRRKDRTASEINWPKVFDALNGIRDDLKEHFPYRVIRIETAEADDVIGVLCQEFSSSENILIVSGDKDFRQLHCYPGVKQYDPVQKKWIQESNPSQYLREHIIRGDRGDGIPNILSPDDAFVTNQRQRPVSSKNLDLWVNQTPEDFCDDIMLRGWKRNQQLVDLNFIPSDIRQSIIAGYHEQSDKGRNKLFSYFVNNRLKNLMEVISDF